MSFRKKLGFLFALLLSKSLVASEIVPTSLSDPDLGQPKFVESTVAGIEMLFVAPPNVHGLSINYFDSFQVTENLKLMNLPGVNSSGEFQSASPVVVIVANNIEISASIDLAGPAADVVFLTNSINGSIDCNGCAFINGLRLSLIAGKPEQPISHESSSLGEIKAYGDLTVQNLAAPGLVALDLVSHRVSTSGNIDVNSRGIPSASGGYSAIAHGSKVIGTGSIELIAGPQTRWDYEAAQLTFTQSNYNYYDLYGHFSAPRVKLAVSGGLQFEGSIDTGVDLLAAVSYKNKAHIPQEGVSLISFSKVKNLVINGEILSKGDVSISASNHVYLNPTATISGATVNVLAANEVANFGSVLAGNIGVAGKNVFNRGLVSASNSAQLWAEDYLLNQYGGSIQARDVVLESQNKVVRNGSRTPYMETEFDQVGFLDLGASEILSDYLIGGSYNSYNFDSSELGAFYLLPGGVEILQSANLTMASNHFAHVVGDTVSISAPAFENINPYYKRVNDTTEVLLDRQRINQVVVSAESSLSIQGAQDPASDEQQTASYVINSSALLSVNKPSGMLAVNAEKFINNRYRIGTYLISSSSTSTDNSNPRNYYYSNEETITNIVGSVTAVYSPPGFVVSMGNVFLDTVDYVANVMGYIEVFGNAEIRGNTLKNFGLENEALQQTTSSFTYVNAPVSGGVLSGSSTEHVVQDPQTLDSLFHIGKNLTTSTNDDWFETLNPFDYFISQSVDRISKPTAIDEMVGRIVPTYEGNWQGGVKTVVSESFSSDEMRVSSDIEAAKNRGDDSLVVNWSGTVTKNIVGESSNAGDEVLSSQTRTESGSFEVSLFDTLEGYYQTVKQEFNDLLAEFDWWGN